VDDESTRERTYRLDLAYDGSGFHGYARQPGIRTVQGILEEALAPLVGPVQTAVAGRTDKGVHALAQVVSFRTDRPVDLHRLRRSLNRRLGPEVAVLAARVAPAEFDARFSATGRAYRYRILNREAPDPFAAATTWHHEAPLDVDAMDGAARTFVGEHDFASFCRHRPGATSVRRVLWSRWRRDGDLLEYSVGATAFCHQMVRSLVALCVEIGRGRMAIGAAVAVLAARDRAAARGVAPPHGLALVAVGYPDEPLRPPPWCT